MSEPTEPLRPEGPPRDNAAWRRWYEHEERMAQANRAPRADVPTFTAKRSTSSGSLGVMALDAYIPVCEEFPDAEAAFEALIAFVDRFNAKYPLPDGYTQPGGKGK